MHSSLHMSCLTSGWNEFKNVPYFSQVLSASADPIFGGTNNEMTNTMMSYIHLYKKQEGGEYIYIYIYI